MHALELYKKDVVRTAPADPSSDDFLCFAALGLGAEAGEVQNVIKKIIHQGHKYDKAQLVEELGDMFFYMTSIMINRDITIEEIIAANMHKRLLRYPRGFDPGRSKNRGE